MYSLALEPKGPASARLVTVDGRSYPLESAQLSASAEGGLATSTLVQKFANPYDEPLEVLYTMPLPADGAVLGYTIQMGERTIRGEIQTREQASEAYKAAVFEGKVAGILEQHRADTFEQRLGNLPPRTAATVSIEVMHPLAFLTAAGAARVVSGQTELCGLEALPQWEYRFPTVVGVRYHGGDGRVPDHEPLSPDRALSGQIPTQMQFTLTVADGIAGRGASSPSHRIRIDGDATISLEHDEALDRDVVMRWPAAAEGVGVRVVEGTGLEGDDGRYALVTLVPPARPRSAFHRDLVVLLDASGSMSGEPLDLAKSVIGDLLRSLEPGDRFELLTFSNITSRLTPRLGRADERALAKGLKALASVEAGGGTEMATAIDEAMQPAPGDRQRQVVLVSDGQISFETEVVGRVAARENVRLHVVGVGHAPNRALTQQAAWAGRGLELLVTSAADASAAARRLVAGTASPVLVQVAVSGSAIAGQAPSRLRDVFAGQPLVFTVELGREGGGLEVRGTLADSREAWVHRSHIPAASVADGLPRTALRIGALRGREVVGELEMQRAGAGVSDPGDTRRAAADLFDHEIEQAALRHRIVSRRTSLVAIAEEPSVDPRAPRRRERLSVELPAGVSAEGMGLEPADAALYSSIQPMVAGSMDAELRTGVLGSMLGRFYGKREERFAARRQGLPKVVLANAARRVGDDILLVEFECPFDGLLLPVDGHQVSLQLSTKPDEQATVVAALGSPRGPHRAGHLLKLAFRIDRTVLDQIGVGGVSLTVKCDREGGAGAEDVGIVILGLEGASGRREEGGDAAP